MRKERTYKLPYSLSYQSRLIDRALIGSIVAWEIECEGTGHEEGIGGFDMDDCVGSVRGL